MIELLSTTEMTEADRLAIAGGIPGIELMENAGRAVAESVAARHPSGTQVVVVAGPGNNGGDGFVAARLLAERRYRVCVLLLGSAIGSRAMRRWRRSAGAELARQLRPAALAGADVVIDALFGAGLDRPVEGRARAMIEAMNAAPCIHAVDLPSGINGTTGAVMGVAVNAAETVTFFRRKAGPPRCSPAGSIAAGFTSPISASPRACSIGSSRGLGLIRRSCGAGISRCRGSTDTNTRAATRSWCRAGSRRPERRGLRHAARCAAAPALSPSQARGTRSPSTRPQALAVMVRPVDGTEELADFLRDPRRNAVVLGPGGGVGRGCGKWSWLRSRASTRWCSMPMP